MAENELNQ